MRKDPGGFRGVALSAAFGLDKLHDPGNLPPGGGSSCAEEVGLDYQ